MLPMKSLYIHYLILLHYFISKMDKSKSFCFLKKNRFREAECPAVDKCSAGIPIAFQSQPSDLSDMAAHFTHRQATLLGSSWELGLRAGDTVPLRVQSAMSRGLPCHRAVMQETGSEMSARAKGALWGCVGWTPSPEQAESKQVSQHRLWESSHADLGDRKPQPLLQISFPNTTAH